MGKKLSGQRPEDHPIFTNPHNMDFEKRRMFSTGVHSSVGSTPIKKGSEYRYVKNSSGGSLAIGDVVVLKKTATGNEVDTTTTEGDPMVLGMVAKAMDNGSYGLVQVYGVTTSLKVNGTVDIAVGDFIGASTVAKVGMKAAVGKVYFAIALEAYTTDDSNGVIDAFIVSSTCDMASHAADPDAHHAQLHATSHKSGGDDTIKLNEFTAPDGAVDFNLQQATDLVVMTVANEAALPTTGIGVGQPCFALAEKTLHICTAT